MAGHVIVLATMKGGGDKSTTAMCLAVHWWRLGRPTAIIDADPQRSVLRWARYANYASYANAYLDGLTDWHPAYLRLGPSLAACACRYARFCRRYRPTEKPVAASRWGAWRLWTG